MAAPTESNNGGRPRPPHAARASLLFGLLAFAAIPVAVAITETRDDLRLLHAGVAVPVAAVLAVVALLFARRARRRLDRTLGRSGGRRTAQVGRILGWLAFYLALIGAIGLGVYAYLDYVASN